jgi:hypothetical protein
MRRILGAWLIAVSFWVVAPQSPAAPADDPIQKAIKKGAKYLREVHAPQLGYAGGMHGMGTAALAGMALLEAGTPEDDRSLKNILKYVRENALGITDTYQCRWRSCFSTATVTRRMKG